MSIVNRQVLLANRPSGLPASADFRLVESPVPELAEGQALIELHYVSVDPYMRGRMRPGASYIAPIEIGAVMGGGGVGRVIASRSPGLAEGEFVEGMTGWQEYCVTGGRGFRKVDPGLAPVSTALGVLGIPGLTAYFGLLEIGAPAAGETVLVSGAAGAVGSIAGQLAKIRGCHVTGTAGSDEKVRWLTDGLGFDAAFNYRTADLSAICPGGVDVYFDNTGGPVTDAALGRLKPRARIVLSGQISQYNDEKPETGPRLLFHLVVKRARMEGFIVSDFAPRWKEGLEALAGWLRAGRLRYREEIVDGIENAPGAFLALFAGANTGKMLVRVRGDSAR